MRADSAQDVILRQTGVVKTFPGVVALGGVGQKEAQNLLPALPKMDALSAGLVELQVPKEIIPASETITKENAGSYVKLGF